MTLKNLHFRYYSYAIKTTKNSEACDAIISSQIKFRMTRKPGISFHIDFCKLMSKTSLQLSTKSCWLFVSPYWLCLECSTQTSKEASSNVKYRQVDRVGQIVGVTKNGIFICLLHFWNMVLFNHIYMIFCHFT